MCDFVGLMVESIETTVYLCIFGSRDCNPKVSFRPNPPPFFPSSRSPTLFDACYAGYNSDRFLITFILSS